MRSKYKEDNNTGIWDLRYIETPFNELLKDKKFTHELMSMKDEFIKPRYYILSNEIILISIDKKEAITPSGVDTVYTIAISNGEFKDYTEFSIFHHADYETFKEIDNTSNPMDLIKDKKFIDILISDTVTNMLIDRVGVPMCFHTSDVFSNSLRIKLDLVELGSNCCIATTNKILKHIVTEYRYTIAMDDDKVTYIVTHDKIGDPYRMIYTVPMKYDSFESLSSNSLFKSFILERIKYMCILGIDRGDMLVTFRDNPVIACVEYDSGIGSVNIGELVTTYDIKVYKGMGDDSTKNKVESFGYLEIKG